MSDQSEQQDVFAKQAEENDVEEPSQEEQEQQAEEVLSDSYQPADEGDKGRTAPERAAAGKPVGNPHNTPPTKEDLNNPPYNKEREKSEYDFHGGEEDNEPEGNEPAPRPE